VSWQEAAGQEPTAQKPLRFDIALQSEGFQRNYYTTVFPVERLKRFNIPVQSEFMRDTAAVLLIGPPLFPKVTDFRELPTNQQTADTNNPTSPVTRKISNKVLRLVDLGPGLSYRMRMCTYDGKSWRPTQEVIFNTPICPTDVK
jgi:hypothetical protein